MNSNNYLIRNIDTVYLQMKHCSKPTNVRVYFISSPKKLSQRFLKDAYSNHFGIGLVIINILNHFDRHETRMLLLIYIIISIAGKRKCFCPYEEGRK